MTRRATQLSVLTIAVATTLATAACGGAGDAATAPGSGGSAAGGPVVGSLDKQAPLYAKLPESVKKSGKLVVGSQLASPPIAYIKDDAKTIAGVNVDLAKELSEELGVPVEFTQMSFSGLSPALQAGKIDAVFDLMNDNPERRKTFDFVDFMHNGLTLLVAAGNPSNVSSVTELCGKSVSGVRGTGFVAYAEKASQKCESEGKKPFEVKQFASAADGRLQVQSGKSQAFLGQTPIMIYLAKTVNDGKTFGTVVDKDYPLETTGMAVSKQDTDLRDVLQTAFSQLISSGDYTKVLEGYGLGDLALEKATVNAGS